MSLPPLTGPTVPAASGVARQLVVFVHGYGADGNDLISLAPHWQAALPDAAFIAPNAPARVPGSTGFQWFAIDRIDPHEMQKGVEAAAPAFDQFLDAELARRGLGPQNLALVGFSQGTMLSLHVGLRRAVPPAAIVGFSGMLAGLPPPDAERPAIFLAHGDSDQVIPAQALFLAAGALGRAGAGVQWHLARGAGHGIDETGLVMAGAFVKSALAGQLAVAGKISCPLG
jgi:phospholipase/carboxylesterase